MTTLERLMFHYNTPVNGALSLGSFLIRDIHSRLALSFRSTNPEIRALACDLKAQEREALNRRHDWYVELHAKINNISRELTEHFLSLQKTTLKLKPRAL